MIAALPERAYGQSLWHLGSAGAAKNRLLLGQVETEDKSNEIEEILRRLAILNFKNGIVTIDSIGCQAE